MLLHPRFVTVRQPPPGRSIRRPTRADPEPAGNPPIFTHAMAVRDAVFVDEQRCSPDMELDEDDPRSWHWVMYETEPIDTTTTGTATTSTGRMHEAGEKDVKSPVGVVRLVPPPHAPHEHLQPTIGDGVDCTESLARHHLPFVRVTRVALLKEYRGRGLSRELVDVALRWAAAHPEVFDGETADKGDRWDGLVLVHAQTRSEALYRRLGFTTDKGLGTWVEENMEHCGMWQTIEVKGRP